MGQQPQDLPAELQRREGRREKIRELRAALEKETAKARAVELVGQADDLRSKAAEATTSPTQRETCTTLAAQHDQQAADLDGDDPDPPAVDSDLPRRGFRQMSLRGVVKARCEWLLVCATNNVLKLWRAVTRPVAVSTAATAA